MIGILLMSHGPMACGMLESAKLFFGEDVGQIEALCLNGEDDLSDFDRRIEEAVNRLDSGQGVVVLCDLLGGTPCNRSVPFLSERVQVVTGLNFSMLLEILGKRMCREDVSDIDIASLIKAGQKGIVNLNTFVEKD